MYVAYLATLWIVNIGSSSRKLQYYLGFKRIRWVLFLTNQSFFLDSSKVSLMRVIIVVFVLDVQEKKNTHTETVNSFQCTWDTCSWEL